MLQTPTRKSARVAARKARDGDDSFSQCGENFQSTPLSQRLRPNGGTTPLNNSNKVHPQVQFRTPLSTPRSRRGTPSAKTARNVIETPPVEVDVSVINDSFLDDLDKIEADARASQCLAVAPPGIQKPLPIAGETANSSLIHESWRINPSNTGINKIAVPASENKSPDMFENDSFDLDCLPASQFQMDPTTPARHSVILSKNKSKKRKTSLPPPPLVVQQPHVHEHTDFPARRQGKQKRKVATSKEKKKKSKFKLAYTNRKAVQVLSSSGNNELSRDDWTGMSEEEKLQLSSWGLPQSILNKYYAKGVKSLFGWQLECLTREGVLEGKNLLYSAPTSAGKTLVAELLMVKRVLELGKKAIMILPYVSVCREKMFSMQEILGDAGIRVEGFMGSYAPPGGFKSVDIAICTIEKANSLINRLLEENALGQVGTVVVDELHLIGDQGRGTLIELILTKIKYMVERKDLSSSLLSQAEMNSPKVQIQVIGMSATLPNLDFLAAWMDAELVVSEYRPVPLVEHILFGGKLLSHELEVVRDVHIPSLPVCIPHDDNDLVYLSLETVLGGHSVLIFCPTKAKCEFTAQRIAQEFWRLGSPANNESPGISQNLRDQLSGQNLSEVLSQLKQCPSGLDETLKKSVAFGVAFHHAGLTYDERDIIESAFKRGVLRVIVATSTLSAGVNLPARRVIISTPMFNGGVLDALTYRQMCGRAGRKGVDTEGESILVCSAGTKPHGIALVQSSLPNIRSALLGSEGALTSSMKRALLEVIASGIATYPEDVQKYARATLLSKSIDMGLFDDEELPESQARKEETITACLQFLVNGEFIRLQKWEAEDRNDEYFATQLGAACLASSLAPDDGVCVYKELQKARKCFVLETDLHIVYQVTPIYLADNIREISWLEFLNIWNDLDPGDKLVGKLIGVDETFIFRAMTGVYSKRNSALSERFALHQRFFVALALNDLVNEMPISKVADKYSLNKGLIQSLQQSASTFAGMVTSFCGKLGWSNFELLLSQFQERLQFGVQRELCDLVRLSTMNGQRARVLYDAGIKTIAELAAAEPSHIENILHKAAPFQSAVHGQTEESVARAIWVIGKNGGLSESEAARSIVNEARQFIQLELGLPGRVQYTDDLNENEEDEVEEKEDEIKISAPRKSSSEMLKSSGRVGAEEETRSNGIDSPKSEVFSASHDSLKDIFGTERASKRSTEDVLAILSDAINKSMDFSDHNQNFNLSSSIFKIEPGSLDCSVRHSTPSHEAATIDFPNKRISAIRGRISDTVKHPDTHENDEMHLNDAEFEAAFGKEFDSVASLMEVSLNISTTDDIQERPALNINSLVVIEGGNSKIDQRADEKKHIFSESDAAAVQAMADDSSAFNSEDMFAEFDEPTDTVSVSGGPVDPSVSNVDDRTSSFTMDSDVTSSGLQSARGRLSQEETILEANIGECSRLKVMKVCSPNFIPSYIFNSSKSLSMAFELCPPKRTTSATRGGIGSKILGRKKHVIDEVTGNHYVALFDGGNKIWVLECVADPEEATKSLTCLIRRIKSPVIIFDSKERLKRLISTCNLKTIPQDIWDPKVAQWMWRYDTEDFSTLSTSRLIDTYVKEDHKKIQQLKWPKHVVEAYLTWHVMQPLKEKLIEKQLWNHYTSTEMPSMVPLLLMELNGFRVEALAMSKMKKALELRAALLEMRAFSLSGRQFNLSSPKEVKQILFRELGLKQPPHTTGTGKDVLAKLNHELANVILEWRKVSSSLHKVMIPFIAERNLDTNRVHGKYSHLTVTGRTVMCEPSLQCVPRDFTLEIHFTPQEISDLRSAPTSTSVIRFGSKLNSIIQTLQNTELSPSQEGLFAVSLRSLFIASQPEFVLVSADYSQLELRILAHLSQDLTLIQALNDPSIDVFISIASKWKKLPPEEINDGMRQEAKGIVYGVIYGMGVRALAETMDVEEADAARFVAEFMRSYPGVRVFLTQSVKTCRDRGFVETISGRRRYLPNIESLNPALRSQAERQAVNTQIQGSAADLVKTAMTRIQARLSEHFPTACSPVQMNAKGVPKSAETICFPILNLHDELMFEVRNSHVSQIISLIKEAMESSLTLSVRLPVVVKCGQSWGSLSPAPLK